MTNLELAREISKKVPLNVKAIHNSLNRRRQDETTEVNVAEYVEQFEIAYQESIEESEEE